MIIADTQTFVFAFNLLFLKIQNLQHYTQSVNQFLDQLLKKYLMALYPYV